MNRFHKEINQNFQFCFILAILFMLFLPVFTAAQNDFDTRRILPPPILNYASGDFGSEVVKQGETMLISAPNYNDGQGCVDGYLFRDGRPVHQQTILSNTNDYNRFGREIALDGSVAVIATDYNLTYVYRFDGFNWIEEQTFSIENEYGFGCSVDISGDRIVIGSKPNDCLGNRVYIYKYNGAEWVEERILQPKSYPEVNDDFGVNAKINGSTIVVAAPLQGGGDFPGYYNIYEYDGSTWQKTDSIAFRSLEINRDDYNMALENDLLVLSNSYYDNYSGALEVFRYDGYKWKYEERITPSDLVQWGMLGINNITVNNEMIAASEGGEVSSHRVHLFKYERNHWQEKYIFEEPDLRNFGSSLSLDEHVLMVGAPYADYKDATYLGVVVLYELITQPANISISNGTTTNRVKINWKSTSEMTESYKIYRDGEEIATTLAGARSYNDYDAISGMIYNYDITAYCTKWGETTPKGGYGWRMPNGRIDGSVQTRYGAGVAQVEITVQPNSGDMTSVLNFGEDTDYAIDPEFESFPDTALTVSFWMRSSDVSHEGTIISFCNAGNDDEFMIRNQQNMEIHIGSGDSVRTGISGNDGNWHHFAVTWRRTDGLTVLYKDGAQVWQGTTAAGETVSSGGCLVLGQDQDKPGGGFDTGQAYSGLLDDVRIWKTARSAAEITEDMSRVLSGTEKFLSAYWTFDDAGRGPEQVIPDLAAGGGHHLTMQGTEMNTEEDAPVVWRTYSDPYGDYTINNIYFEDSREFRINSSKPRHGFDPGERFRTLDRNTPTMTGVNFTDTTSFTVAGRVVQKFGNAVCFVPDAEIWVDGLYMGVKTDARGEFIVSVEEGGQHRLQAKFHEHPMEPAEMVLDVNDDIFNLEFTDTKTDILSGYVRASCQTYIGRADLRIFNQDNPSSAIDTTIKTVAGSGYFQIVLPARKYYTELTAFTASDPLLIPRPEDVVEYFSVTPVDLTDSSVVQNLTYRKPPVIEITGWPEIGCAPLNVPIVEMDVVYPLTIEVYEEFAGERCLVDTGKVTIFDDIGPGNQEPVVLNLQGGIATYILTAGEPNILDGGQRPFQKLLQVEADIAGEISTSETWALVTGHRPREQTFATVSPDLPFMILRDPPGDASYCYFEKDAELKQAMSFNLKTSLGVNTWTQTKLGCKMNLGWMAETVVDVWGSFRNAMEFKIETTSQYEYAVTFKSSRRFTTSDKSIITGEGGDVFMGAALNLIYALTDVIAYDPDSCKVDKYVTLVVGSEGFATNFIYTENHIRNILIPQLEQIRDIYEISGSDSAKIYSNQIDVWDQTLKLNQDLKKKAIKLENRSFSAGAKYEYSNAITVAQQARIEFNLEVNKTMAIEAGAEVGGSGVSGGIEIRMGLGMGMATALDVTQTNTTGYVFDDDDVGDFFSVDIKEDLAYGTPVFNLVAGRSSCPWEKGSQPRDGVSLMIDSHVQDYVPAGESANFILSLGNTSQSDESREYQLRMVHGSNPDGAIVKVSGVAMGGALSYFIPPGEQFTAALTVERGPLANDYEDLQLMFYPPCEYEFWQSGANLLIADTVNFSVHFESPESQVSLIMPEDNWVINQTNYDSLQVLIGDYNLNNPYLQSIKFQYRRTGEGWTTGYCVGRKDVNPEYTTFFWDVSSLPDGNYELRAVNDCGNHGVNYSTVAKGIIDRRALIVMGTPEPSDGILNLGESISVTFSGDLDCGKIDPARQLSLQQEDGTPVSFELACYRNQLLIIPEQPLSNFENQLLTMRVTDIKGVSGNLLRTPVSWSFRVSINPVYWTVSNIYPTVYQESTAQFERTLKNAGNADESFSIVRFPVWLNPKPLQGVIPPGGEQLIELSVNTQLNIGNYTDTVFVQTKAGQEFLIINLAVVKQPPVWNVNPALYTYSMNITGSVILPDGVSNDELDLVSVYVNDECRGSARVLYYEAIGRYLVYLTVYSNQIQGEPIQFRVWDASRGREFVSASGSVTFLSDAALGSSANPLIIEPKARVQSIDLAGGWTWFSMNVNPAQADIAGVTRGLLPSDGDVIKGQFGYSQYQQDAGWVGSLQKFQTGKSYRAYLSDSQELRCAGPPVNLIKEQVPVYPGWTWIGFPAQEIMDVNAALQDLPAYQGDRIKSQTEYAEYTGSTGTWEGSLKNMIPGQGYMIKSAAGGQIDLDNSSGTLPKPISYSGPSDWTLDATRYEYTMSMTCLVNFNKSSLADTSVILGAFTGDACKGLAQLKYIPTLDRYLAFLMIYSNRAAGDTLEFRVYDPAVDNVRKVTESTVFTNDAVTGSVQEPVVLTAEGIGDELVPYRYYLNQNYPNPFNPNTAIAYGLPKAGDVKLEVFNTLGQKVATLVNKRQDEGRYKVNFNASDYALSNGLYFYRLRAGDYVEARKLILLK